MSDCKHCEQILFSLTYMEYCSVWGSTLSLICFDQALMGCPFLGDVDSFERKQGIYMNASNELQKTKDKLQQLQVCSTYPNETYYTLHLLEYNTNRHPQLRLFINKVT